MAHTLEEKNSILTSLLNKDKMKIGSHASFKRLFNENVGKTKWIFKHVYPKTKLEIISVINTIKRAKTGGKNVQMQQAFEVINRAGTDFLISKRTLGSTLIRPIIPVEDWFDILNRIHLSYKHAPATTMLDILMNTYYIPQMWIYKFVALCPHCKDQPRVLLVNGLDRPVVITSEDQSNSMEHNQVLSKGRYMAEISLLHFVYPADNGFRYILLYVNEKTRYVLLKPLHTSEALEIAVELFKIMIDFGVPEIISTTMPNSNKFETAAKLIRQMIVCIKQPFVIHTKKTLKCFDIVENVMQHIAIWSDTINMKTWASTLSYIQWNLNTNIQSLTLNKLNTIQKCNENIPYEAEFKIKPNFRVVLLLDDQNTLTCIRCDKRVYKPYTCSMCSDFFHLQCCVVSLRGQGNLRERIITCVKCNVKNLKINNSISK